MARVDVAGCAVGVVEVAVSAGFMSAGDVFRVWNFNRRGA